MRIIKLVMSGIALSWLVAACSGPMSVAQHRSEAQRYQVASRAASARGDVAAAKRSEVLVKKHEADAVKQQKSDDAGYDWAP